MGPESHELASYFCADHQPGGFALWRRGGERRPRLEAAEILDGMKQTLRGGARRKFVSLVCDSGWRLTAGARQEVTPNGCRADGGCSPCRTLTRWTG